MKVGRSASGSMDGACARLKRLDRWGYRLRQASFLKASLGLHRKVGILRDHDLTEVDVDALGAAWRRYARLLDRDLANVERGAYPRALLYGMPVRSYARIVRALIEDSPAVVVRRRANDTSDLPVNIDLERYPSYYRRNFHWQTDGYLSRRSAELYDLSVEMMFFGTADVMRRQVIPPITHYLGGLGGEGARLLDVGCGTGRTLWQLGVAHPRMALTGLDLSDFYLEVARTMLRDLGSHTLVEGNGEMLPFADGSFDVVTSTFVLHELPRPVRRTMLREMRRVLKTGGLFVIEDSAQLHDAADLEIFMHHFSSDFHEPFFEDYLLDGVESLVSDAGFVIERVESHFLAKLVAARAA